MKRIMNDAIRNTVEGNNPLNIDSFEVTRSILLLGNLGVVATFEISSRGRSIIKVENRWFSATLQAISVVGFYVIRMHL